VTAARKRTDCRNHVLTVFDGATMVGSPVERAGTFHAYDIEGYCLGAFADMRQAARSIPPTHFGVPGAPITPKLCREPRRG
jgi:hypothetical protein